MWKTNWALNGACLILVTTAIVLGVVLSLVFIRLARMCPPAGERRIYAIGLLATAIVYLIFALAGAASARWLFLESLGVIIYGFAAWAGLRGLHLLLAAGWALHVAWDVALHLTGAGAQYTPQWYPWSCLAFDLVVAGAVLALSKRLSFNLQLQDN